MPANVTSPAPPEISVIIPARNEEANLAACLDSLISQTGAAFEIIVVDDHSTDRTCEIAASFSNRGVRPIAAPELPPNWTGKNNALADGSRAAQGQWLLFTDADTVHQPGSLARALAEAREHHADMLSYSPEQIAVTFWEMAILPVIFAELARQYPPSEVRDPNSPVAAANGQYILITREAYNAVGGHAAIASEILEDVALARAIKQSGRKIFFRYAADAVRTRMYRNFGELREGWTKNLALLFSAPVRVATLRALEFILIVGGTATAAINSLHGHAPSAAIAATLAIVLYALFLTRIRRAQFSWDSNLRALFGLPLFSYLLLRSAVHHRRGNVTWKGRAYSKSDPQEMSEKPHLKRPYNNERGEESKLLATGH